MESTQTKVERAVTLVTDLHDINDLLEGASVDEARLIPQGGQVELELDLTRAMPERQSVVRHGFFRRIRTPWTKCQLRLSGLTGMTVKRLVDMPPNQAPILACEAIQGGYRITVQATDGLQLSMHAPQLVGSFADVGNPIESP